jgi:tetratricopeptide (TPR) repeat protein
MTRRGRLLVLAWACLAPAIGARAADFESPDLENVRTKYDVGKYEDSLNIAESALDGELSEHDRAEIHRLAGLAAFNLGRNAEAERHFQDLLRLNPDAELDPFVVAPPAIQKFEDVRHKMASDLAQIRQERRETAVRQARERAEEQERKRRLEEMSRRVTTRTVEKRNFLVNLVPFGAGQFQEGRTTSGLVLAMTEGVLAATSIIAWLWRVAVDSSQTIIVQNTTTGDVRQSQPGIPPNLTVQARNWSYAQYGAGIAFYCVYAYGVLDAIYHHEDLVQTGTETTILPPEGGAPAPPPVNRPPVGSNLSPFLYPTSGGMGAGLTLHF